MANVVTWLILREALINFLLIFPLQPSTLSAVKDYSGNGHQMNKIPATTRFAALVALFFVASFPVTAGMYRWTDDQGNVVYSQQPPPDNRESKRITAPPPPAESPESSLERSRELNEKLNAIQEDRTKAKQERLKAKAEKKERQTRCDNARHDLKMLTERPSNTLYRIGDNEWKRFTQEERSEKIDQLNKVIKENCK